LALSDSIKKFNWRNIYWAAVVLIFVALVLMVRFVLNTSKIYIDQTTIIEPYYVEWGIEKDSALRLNDPYYIKTNYKFIRENLDKLKLDTSIYNPLILRSKSGSSLGDVPQPYVIWKRKNSDTIHILKNNIILDFRFTNLN
jgi:hypothetical protein